MNGAKRPLRVALIGAGKRADYMYGPIIRSLPAELELVGVWSRTEPSARKLAEAFAVPWFTDMDRLVSQACPQIGVVSVTYGAGAQVGLTALQHGLHVLLETPIAHKLAEADAVIAEARRRGLKVEVAEQFHRRPMEQIKLKLIASGIFGKVHSSFNDFAGHGYHGVSVMRSYLGFEQAALRVTGAVRKYPLQPWGGQAAGETKIETQQHGIVEFASGQLGLFHWTDVAYGSPLRWWRSSRFLAERGMGITVGVGLDVREQLSVLSPSGGAPQFITVRRVFERVDGGALVAVEAHTGDPANALVRWENPFRPVRQGHGVQWHDDEIAVAACLMSLVDAVRNDAEPSYGPHQARLDQEIITAIRQSSLAGGKPIDLPMDPASQTA